jgi:hypothetical protein
MTPKEKALELTWKYYHRIEHLICDEHKSKDWEISKLCALLAVDEVLGYMGADRGYAFWTEVKQELEKL